MHAFTVLSFVGAAAAMTTSVSYSNTMTNFLSQTNSLGVVTGQPKPNLSVVTSQPAVVTSQPTPAGGYPSYTGGYGGGAASGTGVMSYPGSNSTVSMAAPTSGGVAAGSATASASASASASTGAAPFMQPAVGLGVAGAFFVAML